jgi:hypothetical protein
LRATSVGFRLGARKFSEEPKRKDSIDFIRGRQLLEWSIVNMPASPPCLFERVTTARVLQR